MLCLTYLKGLGLWDDAGGMEAVLILSTVMVQVVLILRVRTCAHFLRFEAIWRLRVPFPFNEARLQMPRARKWLWAGVVFH